MKLFVLRNDMFQFIKEKQEKYVYFSNRYYVWVRKKSIAIIKSIRLWDFVITTCFHMFGINIYHFRFVCECGYVFKLFKMSFIIIKLFKTGQNRYMALLSRRCGHFHKRYAQHLIFWQKKVKNELSWRCKPDWLL